MNLRFGTGLVWLGPPGLSSAQSIHARRESRGTSRSPSGVQSHKTGDLRKVLQHIADTRGVSESKRSKSPQHLSELTSRPPPSRMGRSRMGLGRPRRPRRVFGPIAAMADPAEPQGRRPLRHPVASRRRPERRLRPHQGVRRQDRRRLEAEPRDRSIRRCSSWSTRASSSPTARARAPSSSSPTRAAKARRGARGPPRVGVEPSEHTWDGARRAAGFRSEAGRRCSGQVAYAMHR